ncbi:hypothetical protein R5W24_001736 [Gemmata sp. JC717]|uniref:DUF1573 domain-containing protein n=1 Tax=Gemmata algarum TaxID=2975278 RepID=A0ABU5F2B4_9BACT|nr:hypothetical protein [Gemmata algarum]MDY3552650.1 hypothetical protein [Gemmata algarum]MDY3561334.1 hypothetical protein [Gemmata algarum]
MSSGATPPPASGGLKSALKVAVPLVALMAVIFGATLFSMYTPKPQEETKSGGDGAAASNSEPPLRFFNSERTWDPPSSELKYRHLPNLAPSAIKGDDYSLQDRVFAGFYEPSSETLRRAAFWFENRNPNPVLLQLKGISCTACSGGRLAAIPPEVTKTYLQRTALASLPIGTFNAFGVGLLEPAVEFDKLEWTTHKYRDDPNATYKVPAAPANPDKWTAQWGILELTFTVSKDPKVPLSAQFATKVEGTNQVGAHLFGIMFAASEACAVSRSTIDVGEINQLTGDREYTFVLYSATRGPKSEFDDLLPPVCTVQATPGTDAGPFVAVTKVVRVPDADLFEVVQETAKAGQLTKVKAAYRVTVAVRPQVNGARIPLGALDRTIYISSGSATAAVKVNAMVKGAVWLANGKTEIEVPTFKGRMGTVHVPELVTESTAVELTVVEDESRPRGFKYQLTPKADRGGQGYYDLRITIPPSAQFGAFRDAVVVLEAKPKKPAGASPDATAPQGQRIRIPVRGFGEQG